MMSTVLLMTAGLGAWTLLEWIIHGPLSHLFDTFAGPLHDVHHRDPHAVFTVSAWLPVAIISLALFGFFGLNPVLVFLIGLISGFIIYEVLHYRIHFARARNRIETRLRQRHLAHHLAPDAIFGVTTSFWDRVFGTEPAPARMRELQETVVSIPALAGPSNWKRAFTMSVRR